ncbi:hypothetical protein F4818DRAFT_435441 [Hypoxylon cercidicola]|nr:hypothetical protein F4818DRAFT_435441 [Hypoxylon cercidicola]
MYIGGKPVLHVVNKATSFQAAKFLQNMTAKHTWDTLRLIWIDTYLGPPDNLIFDAGLNFTATKFTGNAKTLPITVEEVPVEAHNSIGKLERYYGPVRRAYEVISGDLRGTNIDGPSILQMAVKAVNDTAGPDGLVPTLLVFRAYPRLTESSPSTPSLATRAEAIKKAMQEVHKLKAKRQIANALAMRNGPNTLDTLNLPLQSEVRVYRENKEWMGPYQLIARNGETCTVEINDKQVNFRTTVVKPYLRDETTITPGDNSDFKITSEKDNDEYIPEPGNTPPKPNDAPSKPKRRGICQERRSPMPNSHSSCEKKARFLH